MKQPAFILPTTLILSIVTAALAVAFLQYNISSVSILRSDYVRSLARQAAETGLQVASRCYETRVSKENNLTPSWPSGAQSSMAPNSDCTYRPIPHAPTFLGSNKVGADGSLIRISYDVSRPQKTYADPETFTFTAKGHVEQIVAHTGRVISRETVELRQQDTYYVITERLTLVTTIRLDRRIVY